MYPIGDFRLKCKTANLFICFKKMDIGHYDENVQVIYARLHKYRYDYFTSSFTTLKSSHLIVVKND